jgi:cell division protein FtsL
MPAASASAQRHRRPSGRAKPARASARTAPRAARVRWDRLGRLAMLGVLVALLYLYLSAGIRVFSTWHEARRNSALVSQLERQNRQLRAEQSSLSRHSTVVREARQLGMDKPGEQAYVIPNLPRN